MGEHINDEHLAYALHELGLSLMMSDRDVKMRADLHGRQCVMA